MTCRICLLDTTNNLREIFGLEGKQLDIANIVAQHFWFELKEDDPISKSVCSVCWQQVDSFHTFYLRVEKAQKNFSSNIPVENISVGEIKIEHDDCSLEDVMSTSIQDFDENPSPTLDHLNEINSGMANYQNAQFSNESTAPHVYTLKNEGTTTKQESTLLPNPSLTQKFAEKELCDLLYSWGFVDLYQQFLNLGVTVETLKLIDNDDLKEIFSNKSFASKVEFKYKLNQWRTEHGINNSWASIIQKFEGIVNDMELCQSLTKDHLLECLNKLDKNDNSCVGAVSEILSSPSLPFGFGEFDIDTILQHFPSGNIVLKDFEQNNRISETSRSILIDCISSWFIAKKKAISRKEFQYIASRIHDRFNEDEKIYFSLPKSGTNENPSGRLYTRYYNRKRRHKKIGLDVQENKVGQPSSSCLLEDESNETLVDCSAEIKWLQTHSEPWDEIKINWRNTYLQRRRQIVKEKFSIVLSTWPLLKHPCGVSLINSDFGVLCPGKQHSLIGRWDSFKSLIISIFDDKVKDKNCQELLRDLHKRNFSKGPEDLLICNLMHAILPPSMRTSSLTHEPKKRKFFKATIQDSQQSMVLFVDQANDFKPALDRFATKLRDQGQSLQPIIIYSLFDNSFIVHYNEIEYKFESFLPALDTCFKLYFVLNLKFPVASKSVWIFFQRYFFEIDTSDRVSPDILLLINDLKLKSQC